MDLLDEVRRIEQIGLARSRRRAAHRDAAGRALLDEHHRAAGGPLGQGVMADTNAIDRGESRRLTLSE